MTMLLAFGSLREMSQNSYEITVRLNRAGGLRYGSQVTLDGVPIGVVESVALEMESQRPVRLQCRLEWAGGRWAGSYRIASGRPGHFVGGA